MKASRLFTMFYVTLAVGELVYLYLMASLLGGPVYSIVLMLLLYPIALLSGLNLLDLKQRYSFRLEAGWVTLVILVVAGERLFSSLAAGQPDVFGIIVRMGLCGLTWWLGHTVPHGEVKYSTICFRFQIGAIVTLLFAQVSGSPLSVFLFFIPAILALFFARWSSSLSGTSSLLHSPGIKYMLLAEIAVIVPGIALMMAFSPGAARALVSWLGNISAMLSGWLAQQQQPASNPQPEINLPISCGMRPQEDIPANTPLPPSSEGATVISPVVIWLIAFFIFLGILAFILFSLRRVKTRSNRPSQRVALEIRMVSLGLLRNLISFFPQLFKRMYQLLRLLFRRRRKQLAPSEESVSSVRALYRNLLRWAARQGIARLPSQTPLEHLALLEQRYPAQRDSLELIGGVYLKARYSQKPSSAEELESAKKAWQSTLAYSHERTKV